MDIQSQDKYILQSIRYDLLQKHTLGYIEIFAPMAWIKYLRLVVDMKNFIQRKFVQFGVKIAFFYGCLVYVEQPHVLIMKC